QLNVLQRVGGSIGVAVLAVVLQRALEGAHTQAAAASAYGTAFWWSAGLTALAIIPCIVLLRAERAARAKMAAEDAPPSEKVPEVAAA
ncbi:MAG: MFS transporter, partial [Solirubrobacterales bacterium]|nr:MFS transporter [Solirubrobacterales bacterium]